MIEMAWVFGMLGWICLGIGIATALGALPEINPEFTVMFWMVVSVFLVLNVIVFTLGARRGD